MSPQLEQILQAIRARNKAHAKAILHEHPW